MKLSILVCSLENRAKKLERLMEIIRPQLTPEVEVLTEVDDGKMTIGGKRNLLVDKAKGEYVCFIDDDDLVPDYYVNEILQALQSSPDCVGIEGLIVLQETTVRKFIHSLACGGWKFENDIYHRTPNHLNPILRSKVLEVGFPEKDRSEDYEFSNAIFPLLETEAMINKTMYFYLYQTKELNENLIQICN